MDTTNYIKKRIIFEDINDINNSDEIEEVVLLNEYNDEDVNDEQLYCCFTDCFKKILEIFNQ